MHERQLSFAAGEASQRGHLLLFHLRSTYNPTRIARPCWTLCLGLHGTGPGGAKSQHCPLCYSNLAQVKQLIRET